MSQNRLSFPVTDEEREQIETAARADDRTLGQYIRRTLGLPALLANAGRTDGPSAE